LSKVVGSGTAAAAPAWDKCVGTQDGGAGAAVEVLVADREA